MVRFRANWTNRIGAKGHTSITGVKSLAEANKWKKNFNKSAGGRAKITSIVQVKSKPRARRPSNPFGVRPLMRFRF
jgi:hypothetical protein